MTPVNKNKILVLLSVVISVFCLLPLSARAYPDYWPVNDPFAGSDPWFGAQDPSMAVTHRNLNGRLPSFYTAPVRLETGSMSSPVGGCTIGTARQNYNSIFASAFHGIDLYVNGVLTQDLNTQMENAGAGLGSYPGLRVGDRVRIIATPIANYHSKLYPPSQNPPNEIPTRGDYFSKWKEGQAINMTDLTSDFYHGGVLSDPAGSSALTGTFSLLMPMFASFAPHNPLSANSPFVVPQVWIEPSVNNTAGFVWIWPNQSGAEAGRGGNEFTLEITSSGQLFLDVYFWPFALEGKVFFYAEPPALVAPWIAGSSCPLTNSLDPTNPLRTFVRPGTSPLQTYDSPDDFPNSRFVSPWADGTLVFDVASEQYPRTNIRAEAKVCGNGDVLLSWRKPPVGNVTGYIIHVSGASSASVAINNPDATSYTYRASNNGLHKFEIQVVYGGALSEPSVPQYAFPPYDCFCRPEPSTSIMLNTPNEWFARESSGAQPLLSGNLYDFLWTVPERGTADRTVNPFRHPGFTTAGIKAASVRVSSKSDAGNYRTIGCTAGNASNSDYKLQNSGPIALCAGGPEGTGAVWVAKTASMPAYPGSVSLTAGPAPGGIVFNLNQSSSAVGDPYNEVAFRVSALSGTSDGDYVIRVQGSPASPTPTGADGDFTDISVRVSSSCLPGLPAPDVDASTFFPVASINDAGKISVSIANNTGDANTLHELKVYDRLNNELPSITVSSGATWNLPVNLAVANLNFVAQGLNPGENYRFRSRASLMGATSDWAEDRARASEFTLGACPTLDLEIGEGGDPNSITVTAGSYVKLKWTTTDIPSNERCSVFDWGVNYVAGSVECSTGERTTPNTLLAGPYSANRNPSITFTNVPAHCSRLGDQVEVKVAGMPFSLTAVPENVELKYIVGAKGEIKTSPIDINLIIDENTAWDKPIQFRQSEAYAINLNTGLTTTKIAISYPSMVEERVKSSSGGGNNYNAPVKATISTSENDPAIPGNYRVFIKATSMGVETTKAVNVKVIKIDPGFIEF